MNVRVARYDVDLVRDIAEQRLIAFYNANPAALRESMRQDPGFAGKLRTRAARYDAEVNAWLQAIDYVPKDHPDYAREVVFRQWCLRLEPAEPPDALNRKQERETFLRQQNYFYNFDINAKPWLEAVERVRRDRCIKLVLPPRQEESDEEWI